MFGMDKKTKFNLLTYHNMKLFAGIVSRETTLHAFNLIRSEPFDQCKNYFCRIRYTGSTSRAGAGIFRNGIVTHFQNILITARLSMLLLLS